MKKKHKRHTLNWFIARIGKMVYRPDVSCKCKSCADVTARGLKIKDKNHADYLFMVQNDCNVFYYDKPIN